MQNLLIKTLLGIKLKLNQKIYIVKFEGKYSKIEYAKNKKLSNSDLIIRILKHYFKAGEIMTREEVNKFLYSNEFWNEVILMEND